MKNSLIKIYNLINRLHNTGFTAEYIGELAYSAEDFF